VGANPGKAITEDARTANIARAARDLTIGLLTVGKAIPPRLGIIRSTTIVSNGSDLTTYICEEFTEQDCRRNSGDAAFLLAFYNYLRSALTQPIVALQRVQLRNFAPPQAAWKSANAYAAWKTLLGRNVRLLPNVGFRG
jgi:hypothetical protein